MYVKSHYEKHLAKYYSWIFGGLENKIQQNLDFFIKNNILPKSTGFALDLGAGSGFQSIPLAKLGFKVTAIDFSRSLLTELKQHSIGLNITTIEDDILNFDCYNHVSPELIICMGDTITHLDTIESVYKLFDNSYSLLQKSGIFIISFRDLSIELENEHRFIPVASDENRVFTCFLEYSQNHVKVFDMVYEKENGNWIQKISHYRKLRISQEQIIQYLKQIGLSIDNYDYSKGVVNIVARKV